MAGVQGGFSCFLRIIFSRKRLKIYSMQTNNRNHAAAMSKIIFLHLFTSGKNIVKFIDQILTIGTRDHKLS